MENNRKVATSNQRIRELIDSLNISQVEFCEKTGLKTSAVSNYLNDNRTPRQDAIAKIADAYSVNPSWLMGYDVTKTMDSPSLIVNSNDDYFQIIAPSSRFEEYSSLIRCADQCNIEQVLLAIEMLHQFASLNLRDD